MTEQPFLSVSNLTKHFGGSGFSRAPVVRAVEDVSFDVPRGKVTDFYMATQAKEDESVVFSWIEWPDKSTADAAYEKMMSDPDMQKMGEMPFDGMRMMWGGFEPVVDER